jgi:hypothetical protein
MRESKMKIVVIGGTGLIGSNTLAGEGLTVPNDGALLGEIHFEDWLRQSASQKPTAAAAWK